MAAPKSKHDVCLHCEQPIVWEVRYDPNAVPMPGDRPLGGDPAWEAARKAYHEWHRNRPRWHGKEMWFHTGAAWECDGEDPKHWNRKTATPTNFCHELLKSQDYYSRSQQMCNRPVTYEKEHVCGVHAKPYIEAERRQQRYEQLRQEEQAREDQINILVDHLKKLGIEARVYSTRTGDLILTQEQVIKLLTISGEYEAPKSKLDEFEVAEGFNPFLEVEFDEDEEPEEEFEEFA